MNNLVESQLNLYISNSSIIERKILSESFGMKCERISLDNNEVFVAKYYQKNKKKNLILL